MSAETYVNTYLGLWVYLDDETPAYSVSVRNYLQDGLGKQSARAAAAYSKLMGALPKLLGHANKPVPSTFIVEGDTYVRTSIWRAYHGKGAPNEIQDALYLAGRCGLVTERNLLDYIDQNLGVDCGGFVANFWGMGRPDATTPNPTGATGFKPRTIWGLYPSLRRKSATEIQAGDAAIFFSDVKSDDPNLAAHAKAGGGYDTSSGSQAFHIGLVSSVTAGGDQATIVLAESSGAPATSGGNGVNVRSLGQVKLTTAKGLVYCPSGKNRIYFVGRPVSAPPYPPNPWGV